MNYYVKLSFVIIILTHECEGTEWYEKFTASANTENTIALLIGFFGSLFFIIILTLLIWLCYRTNRSNKKNNTMRMGENKRNDDIPINFSVNMDHNNMNLTTQTIAKKKESNACVVTGKMHVDLPEDSSKSEMKTIKKVLKQTIADEVGLKPKNIKVTVDAETGETAYDISTNDLTLAREIKNVLKTDDFVVNVNKNIVNNFERLPENCFGVLEIGDVRVEKLQNTTSAVLKVSDVIEAIEEIKTIIIPEREINVGMVMTIHEISNNGDISVSHDGWEKDSWISKKDVNKIVPLEKEFTNTTSEELKSIIQQIEISSTEINDKIILHNPSQDYVPKVGDIILANDQFKTIETPERKIDVGMVMTVHEISVSGDVSVAHDSWEKNSWISKKDVNKIVPVEELLKTTSQVLESDINQINKKLIQHNDETTLDNVMDDITQMLNTTDNVIVESFLEEKSLKKIENKRDVKQFLKWTDKKYLQVNKPPFPSLLSPRGRNKKRRNENQNRVKVHGPKANWWTAKW